MFFLEKVLIPIVGSLGLVGNGIAIRNMRNPVIKTTFNQSLITLALCDWIFLAMMIIDQIIDKTNFFYVLIFPYFWYPLKNFLVSWDTFLLMSIATERFIALWKPLFYKSNRLSYSKKSHLYTYILPSMVVAIIINIPKLLEIEIVTFIKTNEDNTTTEVTNYGVTDQDGTFPGSQGAKLPGNLEGSHKIIDKIHALLSHFERMDLLLQQEISCNKKKLLVTRRNFLSQEVIYCHKKKIPVTRRNFL